MKNIITSENSADDIIYDDIMLKKAGVIWNNGSGDDKYKWIRLLGYTTAIYDVISIKEWNTFKGRMQQKITQLFFEELNLIK
jgi:hypothetical protein